LLDSDRSTASGGLFALAALFEQSARKPARLSFLAHSQDALQSEKPEPLRQNGQDILAQSWQKAQV
jgi:hypothetical protein